MKGMILGFVLTAMGVVPVACAQEISAAAGKAPLTLTISGPQEVVVGGRIPIRAVLKNVSKRTILTEWGQPFIVLIHGLDGKELPSPTEYGEGSDSFGGIEPEMTSTQVVSLGSEYGLVPGKYVVQLARHVDTNDPKSPIIKSNEITITVLPKLPDAAR